MQKAYKILALRKKISNRNAKEMLDSGMVFVNGKKLNASQIIKENTSFEIRESEKTKIIFEDENILALNKGEGIEVSKLLDSYKQWNLLNRLDKQTSGVILLVKKDSKFQKEAIEEFKKQNVYKEYLALCKGIVPQELSINKPIKTIKNHFAYSKIDKYGKEALTNIKPLKLIGKNTLLQVIIKTGRTHQIRVHLNSIGHPIMGDYKYGHVPYKRLMLHSYKIKLFSYEFCASEGSFWKYIQH